MRPVIFLAALISLHLSEGATAKSIQWTCAYDRFASPSGLNPENYKLEFAYDDVTGQGVMIGNNGLADVGAYIGSEGITFSEKLKTGAIQSTTISKSGESVHSRHSLLSGSFVPTQYYGRCSATVAE